jgi:hypothetical protein
MVRHFVLPTAAVCALALGARAQSFSYSDFTSTAGLTLNGNAQAVGPALRVSSAVISDKGSAFYSMPVSVASGFETTFTFQITAQAMTGADGFTFVVHNDPRGPAALGNHASALGYGVFTGGGSGIAIANSLVVEFDTFTGSAQGDPNDNHISIHTAGTADNGANETLSLGQHLPLTNMSNGAVHTARIRYLPATGRIEVYLNDLVNPVMNVNYDFGSGGSYLFGGTVGGLSLISGGAAYVGFTASAGGSWENHDILSWDFSGGTCTPPVSYCTALISSSGCSPAMLASGVPSLANPAGFSAAGTNLEVGQNGLMFFGTTGQNNSPFFGGTLCANPPLYRLLVANTGGSGACTGSLSYTLADFLAHPVGGPLIVSGQVVDCQVWTRDPPAATTVSLSDGLEFVTCP